MTLKLPKVAFMEFSTEIISVVNFTGKQNPEVSGIHVESLVLGHGNGSNHVYCTC